jgi:hypothetical protein
LDSFEVAPPDVKGFLVGEEFVPIFESVCLDFGRELSFYHVGVEVFLEDFVHSGRQRREYSPGASDLLHNLEPKASRAIQEQVDSGGG